MTNKDLKEQQPNLNGPDPLPCQHFLEGCGACAYWHIGYQEELKIKTEKLLVYLSRLNSQFPDRAFAFEHSGWVVSSDFRLRDRMDFKWQEAVGFGFFDKHKDLIKIKNCSVLSSELNEAFLFLQTKALPIKKASLRLRVSPPFLGQARPHWGLWIDAANADIKHLLEEKNFLMALYPVFQRIELGQKRKKLFFDVLQNRFRLLADAEEDVFFITKLYSDQEFPLRLSVGGFSQSSFFMNLKMIDVLFSWFKTIAPKAEDRERFLAFEMGAGSGNWSLPLASYFKNTLVTENDRHLLRLLVKNTELAFANGAWAPRVLFFDFYQKELPPEIKELLPKLRLILANPPRSGLTPDGLLNLLQHLSRPLSFIYISCSIRSFFVDAEVLYRAGFYLKQLRAVDQFARSEHFELMAWFERA